MTPGVVNLLQGLGAAALFAIAGYGLVGTSEELRRSGPLARAAWAYLAGVTVVGTVLWAASHLLGLPLSRPWVTGLWLLSAIAGGTLGLAGARRAPAQAPLVPRPPALRTLIAGALLLGALVSAAALARAATRPVDDWDGRMIWTAHARYLLHAESVDAPALREGGWLVNHPDYPILMPLAQVATLQLWGSVDERAIRPLYALMLPALLLVAWDTGRRLAGEFATALAVGLAAGLPMLVFERDGGAASTYSDLPLACFWGGALLLLVSARRPAAVAWPAGVLLAGAVLTKNEGLPLAVIALAAAALALARLESTGESPRQSLPRRLAPLLPAAVPPLGALLLHRSWASGIERRLTEDYLSGLLDGSVAAGLERLSVIAHRVLERSLGFETWLGFWALFALLLVAGGCALRSSRGQALALALLGAVGLYFLAYLASPWVEIDSQVRVTWDRFLVQMLLPALGLASLTMAVVIRGPRVGAGSGAADADDLTAVSEGRRLDPEVRNLAAWLAVGLAFLGLTLLYLAPPPGALTTAVPPDPGDPLFNVVILEWGLERAGEGFEGVWSPPFFHPTPRALALSDHLLGPVVQLYVLGPLLPTPAARYNFLLFLSFVLAGLTTTWVLRRSGVSLPAAFLGGCVFVFSPFRWEQLSHLAVLSIQWAPVTLWLFDRLLAAPRPRTAVLFLLVYALHVTGGSYLAMMIHVPLLILLASRWADQGRRLFALPSLSVLVPTALGCALVLGTVYFPYLQARSDLQIERTKEEILAFGAVVPSLVTPSYWTWYAKPGWSKLRRGEDALFPGFLASVLAVAGGWLWVRRRRQEVATVASPAAPGCPPRGRPEPVPSPWGAGGRWLARVLLLAPAVAGALLADAYTRDGLDLFGYRIDSVGRTLPSLLLLGALLAWLGLRHRWGARPLAPLWRGADPWQRSLLLIGLVCLLLCFPLFYLPARHLLPGLGAMRVPMRFFAFVSLTVAWLSAVGFDHARARLSAGWRWAFTAAVAVVLVTELAPRRVPWIRIPPPNELPPIYHWLATAPEVDAILELPVPRHHPHEIARMLAQLHHRKPLANGYSGYLPQSYLHLSRHVHWPEIGEAQLELLRHYGISHLILDLAQTRLPLEWHEEAMRAFEERFVASGQAEIAFRDDDFVALHVFPERRRVLVAPQR